MLAYLDALLAALASRDTAEIDRLLAHPLVRILSPDALADVTAQRRAAAGSPPGAPLKVMQLRHRTAQLLGEPVAADAPETAEVADATGRLHAAPAPAWSERRSVRYQMELPLSA